MELGGQLLNARPRHAAGDRLRDEGLAHDDVHLGRTDELGPRGMARSEPPMPMGTTGTPAFGGQVGGALEQGVDDRPGLPLPLREQHERLARFEHLEAALHRLAVDGAPAHREPAQGREAGQAASSSRAIPCP